MNKAVEYRTVSLPVNLLRQIDVVVTNSKGVYSSRADFVRQAIVKKMNKR